MHGPIPKRAPSLSLIKGEVWQAAKEGKAVAALGRGESTCM
jgi:hypothetical protein